MDTGTDPSTRWRRLILALVLLSALAGCGAPPARGQTALVLERTIELKDVKGRIDHLAIDARSGRLYVAALGNGSVEAIDLAQGAVVGRVSGLAEPQGLAFLPSRGELAVATGGDGALRFYRAADLSLAGSVVLGGDADNVRLDPRNGDVVVGHGSGALAIIDPATRQLIGRVALPAHPEGFQLDGDRAYINLPDAGRVAAADTATGKIAASWPNGAMAMNFPLALDRQAGRIAIVYRLPAKLVIHDAATGARIQVLDTCGDADDVFFDAPRSRLYVVCGGGSVDVFTRAAAGYARTARIATRKGARTGLFAPDLDRLFVAARAGPMSPAAILVFKPGR